MISRETKDWRSLLLTVAATAFLTGGCSDAPERRVGPRLPAHGASATYETYAASATTQVRTLDSNGATLWADTSGWSVDYPISGGVAHAVGTPAVDSTGSDSVHVEPTENLPYALKIAATFDSALSLPSTDSVIYRSVEDDGSVTFLTLSAEPPAGSAWLPCIDDRCPVRRMDLRDSASGALIVRSEYNYTYDAGAVAYRVSSKTSRWYLDNGVAFAEIKTTVSNPQFGAAVSRSDVRALASAAVVRGLARQSVKVVGEVLSPRPAYALVRQDDPCKQWKTQANVERAKAAYHFVIGLVTQDPTESAAVANHLANAECAMEMYRNCQQGGPRLGGGPGD